MALPLALNPPKFLVSFVFVVKQNRFAPKNDLVVYFSVFPFVDPYLLSLPMSFPPCLFFFVFHSLFSFLLLAFFVFSKAQSLRT